MAWFDELPDSLTFDTPDGLKAPLREHEFIKQSPDLGHFANKAFAQHRELGGRIPIRKAETPEAGEAWRKEYLPKLWDAGVLERPPAKPEEYEIKKPDTVDAKVWSDERAGKLGGLLHKYHLPKSAAQEFLALHAEAVNGANIALKTDQETAMQALKTEHGDKFEERAEATKRLTKEIFQTPEELEFFELTGLADHPKFLSVMMRLSSLASSDSSFVPGAGKDGRPSGDDVKAEIADIMSNPQNPKYKLYWLKDKATMEYVEGRYRAAYGDGKVTIS